MIKFKKKNGEKGNWFSFQGLTGISVWITFCNELFVTWFACLQLEILWGTICLFVVKEVISFFFVLRAVIQTGYQSHWWDMAKKAAFSAPGAGSRKEGRKTDWVVLKKASWRDIDIDGLVTKKPNWIFKSSLLALTLKPKLIYLHRLLNVLKNKTDKTVLNLEQYLYGQLSCTLCIS